MQKLQLPFQSLQHRAHESAKPVQRLQKRMLVVSMSTSLLSCHGAVHLGSLLPNENCPTTTALEKNNSKS